MIDTHCHLTIEPLSDHITLTLKQAREASVFNCINISVDIASSEDAVRLTQRYKNVFTAVGVHPDSAMELKDPKNKKRFEQLVRLHKVKAVGEIGLDYYRIDPNDEKTKEIQKEVFAYQMHIAQRQKLPIVIHSRASAEDTLQMLDQAQPEKAVMHCFSYNKDIALRFLKIKPTYMLSFTGIITYPKSDELIEVLKWMDMERVMVETDSPFLAPQRYRGKTNQPAYLPEIVQKIADIKGLKFEAVAMQTEKNAKNFFGI